MTNSIEMEAFVEVPFDIADFDSIADFKVLAKSDTFISNEEVLACLSKATRAQKAGEVTFYDSEADDFFPSCDPKTEEPFDPPATYENVIQSLQDIPGDKKTQAYCVFTHEGKFSPVIGVLVARDSDVMDDQHLVFVVG